MGTAVVLGVRTANLLLVRAEEWLGIAMAVAGVVLGLWFARDNWRDLQEYRAKGYDGFAELAAVMPIRSGVSKAILHALLAILPITGLTTTPPRARYVVAVVFFGALFLGQVAVITAQMLNQRDRLRLRRTLTVEEARA